MLGERVRQNSDRLVCISESLKKLALPGDASEGLTEFPVSPSEGNEHGASPMLLEEILTIRRRRKEALHCG